MTTTATNEVAALAAAVEALSTALAGVGGQIERAASYAAQREWRTLLRAIPEPERLEHWGRKIYSQNDEDGILAEILRRLAIDPDSGLFVECGVGDGLENNTHYLLRQGYSGLWFEASARAAAAIRQRFRSYLAAGRLAVHERFLTAEAFDRDLRAVLPASRDVVVLSIDIDGNDYWIWQALACITPAVAIVEYNGKWPPPLAQVQVYRPDFVWDGTDYTGASLSAFVKLGASKGYALVGCNITGQNAFFVRRDLLQDRFPYELTAEHLYHPPRYDLTWDCFGRVGHRPAAGEYETV